MVCKFDEKDGIFSRDSNEENDSDSTEDIDRQVEDEKSEGSSDQAEGDRLHDSGRPV